MHLDLLRNYLAQRDLADREEGGAEGGVSRRTALTMGATAAGLAASLVGASSAGAGPAKPTRPAPTQGDFDDTYFDYADPANLSAWAPSIYGANDQRGAFNEVTPAKTADALKLLQRGQGQRGVRTFQLGELMSNGIPAFVTTPPRFYDQRLVLGGYPAPAGFVAAGGIDQQAPAIGVNQVTLHEERFGCRQVAPFTEAYSTTYQIGTQLDNLNHVGAGIFFYNGFEGPDIARWWGTTALGAEHMGPIVTRGVLLDVLGVKLVAGVNLGGPAGNGQPVLQSNYRITIDDLQAAMDLGGIRSIEPGDAVMIRTGWNQLLHRTADGDFDPDDLVRWGAQFGMPGIYLAEARWLATRRPAIVGSDTWGLEVLGSSSNQAGVAFPVHQELLMRHGIRIAESVVLDALAGAGVYEYVHIVTPQFAKGATAGNTPPAGLGVVR